MVVHVSLPRNKSDVKVNNMSLDASICKPDGKVIVQRYLNAAQAAPQAAISAIAGISSLTAQATLPAA